MFLGVGHISNTDAGERCSYREMNTTLQFCSSVATGVKLYPQPWKFPKNPSSGGCRQHSEPKHLLDPKTSWFPEEPRETTPGWSCRLAFCLWWQVCPPHTQSRAQRQEKESLGQLALRGAGSVPNKGGQLLSRLPGGSLPAPLGGWDQIPPPPLPHPRPGNLLQCCTSSCVLSLRGHEKVTFMLQAHC